jgi:GTP-binding protein Era
MAMKSAWITLIGRPSVGKSTLVNRLCGRKISIVASSPQTTRSTVRGILTEERGQLVFADTPGYHISDKKLNRYLKTATEAALVECELVLYIIDATRSAGQEEREIAGLLAPLAEKVVVAVNKSDLPEASILAAEQAAAAAFPGRPIFTISAETGEGTEALLNTLFELSPEGELLYPEEFYTDQDPEFRVTEIIREQVIGRLRQELPHAVYVAVEDMESDGKGEKLWIRAVIYVERESQKGIVVGKGGSGIAAIRKASQAEIARLFPYRIYLDLRVKSDPKWRNRDQLLKRMTGN